MDAGLAAVIMLQDSPGRRRQELEFWSALGAVLRAVKGNAALETGAAYAQAIDLWEQLGSPSEFLYVPYAQSYYHMITGKFSLSRSHLEAAPRSSYPAFRGALVHQTGIDPQVTAQAYLGVVLFCLGFPDQSLAHATQQSLRRGH